MTSTSVVIGRSETRLERRYEITREQELNAQPSPDDELQRHH